MALALAAPLTEWTFKPPVSIPIPCKNVLSHLAIVLLRTRSCFTIYDRINGVLGFSESKVLNFRALALYCCSVTTRHALGSTGINKSAKSLDSLLCFDKF